MKLHASSVLFILCMSSPVIAEVRTGLELLAAKNFEPFRGKRVGLVVNHTAVDRKGRHLVDLLKEAKIEIGAIFGPEHGYRGINDAGANVADEKAEGIPIYSLYGNKKYKPTPEQMKGLDLLVFDIQDVGVKFYTYISTLFYTLEAAADAKIPFWILDRPNPIRGDAVSGPICETAHLSFVGIKPFPVRHGLTVGELARLFSGEGWLAGGAKADVHVVELEGWSRKQWFDASGLPWIPPSPNLPTLDGAILYPGTCLWEGTNLSEGRGTDTPFEVQGAPWVDAKKWKAAMEALSPPGAAFDAVDFSPRSIPGKSASPKFKGQACRGLRIRITDRDRLDALRLGLELVQTVRDLHPKEFKFSNYFDTLMGTAKTREAIEKGVPVADIVKTWASDETRFRKQREPYLLYR